MLPLAKIMATCSLVSLVVRVEGCIDSWTCTWAIVVARACKVQKVKRLQGFQTFVGSPGLLASCSSWTRACQGRTGFLAPEPLELAEPPASEHTGSPPHAGTARKESATASREERVQSRVHAVVGLSPTSTPFGHEFRARGSVHLCTGTNPFRRPWGCFNTCKPIELGARRGGDPEMILRVYDASVVPRCAATKQPNFFIS